jgi:hypothetical protein
MQQMRITPDAKREEFEDSVSVAEESFPKHLRCKRELVERIHYNLFTLTRYISINIERLCTGTVMYWYDYVRLRTVMFTVMYVYVRYRLSGKGVS